MHPKFPQPQPTADDIAGMQWWNSATRQRRAYWLKAAQSSVPKDAWEHYKRVREIEAEIAR